MNFLADWEVNKNIVPSAIALAFKSHNQNYSDLEKKINSHAHFLMNKGIKENSLVPIISGHNPDFIINVFSLWKIGAVPAPINTRYTSIEIEDILKFINSQYLVAEDIYLDKIGLSNYQIIPAASEKEVIEHNNFITPALEQTAVIIFTSGSSGKPKGVELTFNNLIQSALTGGRFLNQSCNDRWLASLPFYHIGGFSIIIRAVLSGASIIIPFSLSIEDLCNSITSERPSLASLVSTQLLRIIEAGCTPNKELRNVLLGGGFIETPLIQKALVNNWKISKVYGSSETSSMITALDCTKEYKSDSAGKALLPNEIRIVNDNNEILSPNNSGQIIVKGPAVTYGYLNNPEETTQKFINGFYHTGDLGYLDEEGFLFVEARRTDLIVTGGENVNCSEVENEILKYPDIIEASVFPIEDAEWGQIVAAAITTENKKITPDEIKHFLKDLIAGYKIPKEIILVDKLPKTELGKIQKEKLKSLFKSV